LAAVYWFAVRPLPQTSGSVTAPVSQRVTIPRDALGVPHITAANDDDVLFAQGYAAAQDRLWQMDLLRRAAAGEMAEIFGPAALENDQEMRRLRIRRLAEAASTTLPPADRAALAAYARGVNHFIDTHLQRLPIEFRLLGYQPRPWRVADSLIVGLYLFRMLTTSWRDEIVKEAMLAGGDPSKVRQLFPVRAGREAPPGSNAWAIAGSLTASGRPILAGDMHLEATLPSIWLLTHLDAPGLRVAGISAPGLPGIIAGHNDRFAWSMTSLGFDVQDLHVLTMDERTGRYQDGEHIKQARAEMEVIRVRGGKPVELVVWNSRWGPLFVAEGNRHMALRWVAAEPGVYQYPLLELARARDWTGFTTALARFPGPAQTFVYADVDGNIGFHVAGKLPIRAGYAGDIPERGGGDWSQLIPFDQLPHAFNPPSGMVVSSNQNPFPAEYPYPVAGSFAPPDRWRQITNLLGARKGWKAEEMLTVQKDVYSGFSHFLARALVGAFDRRKPSNPRLRPAADLLRAWDGQMEKDLAAPLIVTLAFQHLRRALVESATRRKGAAWETQMSPAVLETLLRDRPGGWFANWDETLIRAQDDAMEVGARIAGREPSRWKYGDYVVLRVRHPVGTRAPWYVEQPLKLWWIVTPWRDYDNYTFDIGPVPLSGSSTTIKQSTQRVIPSMRLIVDLGDFDRSLANIAAGQSGQILSAHYKDQFENHYYGRSFPMQFQRVEAVDTLELAPAR
jgi:penicillin amidase